MPQEVEQRAEQAADKASTFKAQAVALQTSLDKETQHTARLTAEVTKLEEAKRIEMPRANLKEEEEGMAFLSSLPGAGIASVSDVSMSAKAKKGGKKGKKASKAAEVAAPNDVLTGELTPVPGRKPSELEGDNLRDQSKDLKLLEKEFEERRVRMMEENCENVIKIKEAIKAEAEAIAEAKKANKEALEACARVVALEAEVAAAHGDTCQLKGELERTKRELEGVVAARDALVVAQQVN
jgi:hypothetical protein